MSERMRKALEKIASDCGRLFESQSGTEWLRSEVVKIVEIAAGAVRDAHAEDVRVAIQVASPPREILARSATGRTLSVTRTPKASKSDAVRQPKKRKPAK